MKNVLISGYGDIGQRVAKICIERGVEVTGLRRTVPSQTINKDGTEILALNLDEIETSVKLPDVDVLFHFAPPPPVGQTDPRLPNILSLISANTHLSTLVLISTSAVYGDCQGNWVTEQTATNPLTDRGKRRLNAEQTAKAWCGSHNVRLVILRVPGIYGPGRLPVARLKKGLPVLLEAEAPFTNRIHSDDLANICVTVAEQSDIEGIYNVSDGEPGNMTQYFLAVADACGLQRPQQVNMEEAKRRLSPGMLSYLAESRRIDNKKLMRDTGITLLYPTLEKGLRASIKSD